MNRYWKAALLTFGSTVVGVGILFAHQIGDVPAVPQQLSEADIENGRVSFQEVVRHGEKLFTAVFNKLDGQGRPNTTADGKPRFPQPAMARMLGPDSHSCASCHNR